MFERPTLPDVIEASHRIAPYVKRTPLHRYLALDRLLGGEVYVKHENHQRLGAFKMRGGVNLIAQLSDEQKRRGVTAASTGNHGQAVAYAAGVFGVETAIVVPEGANPGKVESMRNLGANVIFHGEVFDDSLAYAARLAREDGYRFIHSANEPHLIAGVGTVVLEILEDLPDVDVIVTPVGGGSGACGACTVAKSINPDIRVVGVQSEMAPAVYLSWKGGRIVNSPSKTIAEGLATGSGYELTNSILADLLDDFILVSDPELEQAVVLHLEYTHNLTEHAGAASLAGAMKLGERLRGKKVALVMSGGNISVQQLRTALGTAAQAPR